MKIQVCEEVTIDTEVSISVEDITSALNERLVALQGLDVSDTRYCAQMIMSCVTDAWQLLNAITPEMIAKMQPKHRAVVVQRLREQASRWE